MDIKRNWLDRPIHSALPAVTNEILIFALVFLLAIATRFYDLGSRVMSHDESLHTYFSWLLYRGQGYEHSPMMHGPLQFHLIALSYFLFGASDFTARIPAVLFSIATVWMVWYWRKYLGKWGALIAGFLLVISPYMLYYGRYVRNEAFVGFSGILMLYAMLRHLESGGRKYLYMLAFALMIHFTAKETSFIYTAQALVYLAVYFIVQVSRTPWRGAAGDYRAFIVSLCATILLAGWTLGYGLYTRDEGTIAAAETAQPAIPDAPPPTPSEPGSVSLTFVFAAAAVIAFIATAFFLIRGYTWARLKSNRSFELMMVAGTIVLPQLSPFLINMTGIAIPTSAPELDALAGNWRSILIIGACLLLTFLISVMIGMIWNPSKWWKASLLFWVPYVILYTTVFTNTNGFFTGTIGSLGYWLVQHGVERGSQPWYYYLLVQIPVYEFLPALGLILALILGFRRRISLPPAWEEDMIDGTFDGNWETNAPPTPEEQERYTREMNFINMFSLLAWWSLLSFFSFTFAGERMPWLTYHIAWPMILITGWALGNIIDVADWEALKQKRMPAGLAAATIFILGAANAAYALNLPVPPFQGQSLEQLQATAGFLLPLIVAVLAAGGAVYLMREWTTRDIRRVFTLVIFGFLAVFTVRASFRASYITYDQATEFLVYAHGAAGIKEVMQQAEEISLRTAGDLSMPLAYDASAPDTGVSWPFVWYLRDFTNQRSFDQPTRSLRESVVIIVDEKNFSKIDPAIGPGYYRVDYIRMWWPMQDYFGLVSDRGIFLLGIEPQFADELNAGQIPTEVRAQFEQAGRPLADDAKVKKKRTDRRWEIADGEFKYYIRKDEQTLGVYYYEDFPETYACSGALSVFKLNKFKDYSRFCEGFTNPQIRAGLLQIWLNRDYTLYAQAKGRSDLTLSAWQPADQMRLYIRKDVATQIWNYGAAPSGEIEAQDPTEGKYTVIAADLTFDSTLAEPVILNAPRAIAFARDGTLYVADSHNHRILHINLEGKVLHEWGTFADGVSAPIGDGTFNEPWGVAVGPDGSVYVADTWNHRIEKFTASGKFLKAWGSFGQGNEPPLFYGPRGLAVDSEGRVYVTDTGNKRIVVFDADGNYITEFGSAGFDPGQFDEPTSVAVDKNGTVYVADAWNQRVQTFKPVMEDGSLVFRADKQWDIFGWFGQSLDNKPFIAVNDDLHVFVTDPEGYRVIEFDSDGEVIRVWGDYGDTNAGFGLASGIAVDPEGKVWVTDGVFNRIMRFTLP
ncbi:MAG: TIGR03663 family protein [Chloroflexi bacterium CFX1]|nr:TIGR03663 family protein [Chloroflexi bacterium CFX1]MCQ3954660.1 hypothetical protein [Chloroflexota bacterium]MDL1920900.1 TIGR03663 family protein [Chloroflexi bacterium CFX5]NUQ60677.1 TIGR03663 family protein [Anaerolineales bacterium]